MDFYRECDGLTFQADGHRYELNGQRMISLTQIIAAAGLIDYSAVNPQVLEDKAKFGTKIHEYTLWNDKGDLDMDDLARTARLRFAEAVEGGRDKVEALCGGCARFEEENAGAPSWLVLSPWAWAVYCSAGGETAAIRIPVDKAPAII